MRVGFDLSVCAFNQAGVARYAEALLPALRGLAERELEIVPLALPPAFRAVAPGLKRKSVSLLWELFYGPFWLPALAHRQRLDVLHLTMPLPVGSLPCPVVTMIHDAIPFLFPEWFAPVMGARLRRWIREGARRSTHLLTNSHHTARDVERLALAPGKPITTTYLASSLEAGHPAAAPAPDRPYILTVGTLEPRKNLATVLDAYQRLVTHVPHPPELVVVGATGWLADEVLARARQLALGERVRLLGYVSDAHLAHLYAQAAMLVFPALYEGFGIPPLEALGFGCPVIVSNVSSLPEVVGEAGLLVKPTDAPSLAAAMNLLLTQPALAAELRARGRQQAARFSWSRCAQETASVYRQVLAPTRPQPALARDG